MSMRIPEMLIVSLSFRMSETVRDSLSLIDSEKLKGPLSCCVQGGVFCALPPKVSILPQLQIARFPSIFEL